MFDEATGTFSQAFENLKKLQNLHLYLWYKENRGEIQNLLKRGNKLRSGSIDNISAALMALTDLKTLFVDVR